MGRKEKPRLVPEQDKRICGTICLCQLTVVLSSVALVYLTFAIYLPSKRAFGYGIDPVPVMCQTTNATNVRTCTWSSCGEWCLSKSNLACTQILVTVRRNGSDLTFKNCTNTRYSLCPPIQLENLPLYNCNDASSCKGLTGIFNCPKRFCYNLTGNFSCHYELSRHVLDSDKDNEDMEGYFECNRSYCRKFSKFFGCDRVCKNIPTANTNMFLRFGNDIITSRCSHAVSTQNGTDQWYPTEDRIMMASCLTVSIDRQNQEIKATDCINGTTLAKKDVPWPYMNFTQLWEIYENSDDRTGLDDPEAIAMDTSLTIFNETKLRINLEGCVNTLRGECKVFNRTYGKDGDNNTAPSRFPCFHNPDKPDFVITRFNLEKTRLELLIAAVVPVCLFVLSFVTLLMCTHSVKVGDDSKMRCKYCASDSKPEESQQVIGDRIMTL